MDNARWEIRRSRGGAPAISPKILTAVVIAVGGAVWSYAQGASTVFANDYINGTMSLLNEVIERFTIEHVSNNTYGNVTYVWIYNYGDVDIILDIYVNSTDSKLGTEVSSGKIVKIQINMSNSLNSGDEVIIKAITRRQNSVYYKYYAH